MRPLAEPAQWTHLPARDRTMHRGATFCMHRAEERPLDRLTDTSGPCDILHAMKRINVEAPFLAERGPYEVLPNPSSKEHEK